MSLPSARVRSYSRRVSVSQLSSKSSGALSELYMLSSKSFGTDVARPRMAAVRWMMILAVTMILTCSRAQVQAQDLPAITKQLCHYDAQDKQTICKPNAQAAWGAIEIVSPANAKPVTIYCSPALFGTPLPSPTTPLTVATELSVPSLACDTLTPSGHTVDVNGTNHTEFSDALVVVDRGTCFFTTKARNGQVAGAKAIVVVDSKQTIAGQITSHAMGPPSNQSWGPISIPVCGISLEDGGRLKSAVKLAKSANTRLVVQLKFVNVVPYTYSWTRHLFEFILPFGALLCLSIVVTLLLRSTAFRRCLAVRRRGAPEGDLWLPFSREQEQLSLDYSTYQIELLEQTPITNYAMLVPVDEMDSKDDHPRETELAERTICESCSICLEDFQGSDEVRQLMGCHHVFHRECIDRWLTSPPQVPTLGALRARWRCPLCRAPAVLEPTITVTAASQSQDTHIDAHELSVYATASATGEEHTV